MAKYRGNSDDWLDDEEERGSNAGARAQKKKKLIVDYLDPSLSNAMVAEVFPNQCQVLTDAGERLASTYRKAKLPQKESRDRAPVAVGDRVRFEKVGAQDGVIDGVCQRRNELVRPAPARATRHVLTANLDLLVIVAASREPEFSSGLVDRFLIAAQAQRIPAVIAVSKMDLWNSSAGEKPWSIYSGIGVEIHEVCARSGMGLDLLKQRVAGQLTAFCGHSGVGKTSLLNTMMGYEVGRTGEVNEFTGKGQHTTTGAYLIPGTRLIDTPGIRAFGLLGIPPEQLKDSFPEFQGLSCATPSCLHRDEEGCQARALPRYPSYRRILESLFADEG